jgi:hypothetical protein
LSNGDRPGRAPGGEACRCESPVETSELATLPVAPDVAVDIAEAGTSNPERICWMQRDPVMHVHVGREPIESGKSSAMALSRVL